VQTEDIGRIFSTAPLASQAAYENERRWLSLDLLCGRVDRHHPFYCTLRSCGITDGDLAIFESGDGRPDVIGVNHYLTSDRFLDHRIELYPHEFHGGNGQLAYADVAAARMRLPAQSWGPRARLMEVWHRYEIPLAVTEVHNGSTIGEQIRWIREVHGAILACIYAGADVRAITAWACCGALDWPSLMTRQDGLYEPGLFDIRHDPPRPTDLACVFSDLARAGLSAHPHFEGGGWWTRAQRYHHRARRMPLSHFVRRFAKRLKANEARSCAAHKKAAR
jgi:dTDP-4-dehydrorhamnose reductase